MGKNRINKLIVPLTIRSASILSAFTIMATSMGGCATKKNENSKQTDTSINTSSETETEITNNSNIITSTQEEESTTEKKEEKPATSAPETTAKAPQTANKSDNTTKPPTSDNNNNNNNNNHDEKPPKEDDNKFIPLTTSNINNITVFERAVMEVSRKTRGGFGGVWYYNYDEEVYESYGLPVNEMKYILATLNSEYISNDTLNYLLGEYSEEEIKRFYRVLSPMIGFVGQANCTNNWDGLILNPKILKEFKDIEKAFLDYKFNNNQKPLRELLNNYDSKTSNPLVGYYLSQACDRSDDDKEDQVYINQYLGLYFDMKEECELLAKNMYNKSHGKIKTLE